MYGVIFPRHFEYRVVRCKISNIAVWGHFARNRALAANVRRLEILDERSTEALRIPSDILASDTELESSSVVLRVGVEGSTRLVAFSNGASTLDNGTLRLASSLAGLGDSARLWFSAGSCTGESCTGSERAD